MENQTDPNPIQEPVPTSIPTEKSKNNSVLIILCVFIIILVGIVAFLAYQNYQLQKQITSLQAVPSPTPTASQAPNGDLANWKTYTDPKNQFSFKYPTTWTEGKPAPEDALAIATITSDEKIGDGIEPFVYYVRVSKTDKATTLKYTDLKKVNELSNSFSVYKTEQLPSRSGMLTYLFTNDEKSFIQLSLDPYNSTPGSTFRKQDTYTSTFTQILSTFKFLGTATPSATPVSKACTMEAKLCPNGSYVGRTGPNCEFSPCPQ